MVHWLTDPLPFAEQRLPLPVPQRVLERLFLAHGRSLSAPASLAAVAAMLQPQLVALHATAHNFGAAIAIDCFPAPGRSDALEEWQYQRQTLGLTGEKAREHTEGNSVQESF